MSPLASLERIPSYPYLSGRCQRASNIGVHSLLERIRWRLRGGLGLRGAVRDLFRPGVSRPTGPTGLGKPSVFEEGDWVRVRSESEVRATLDGRRRLRGLEFGPQQWVTCGKVFRVSKVVLRIVDDDGILRKVSGTVLLDDVHCGWEEGSVGCGRACPMLYRDEWLEGTDAPTAAALDTVPQVLVATVRGVDDILGTLDPLGRRESLMFMPEMARYAGKSLAVRRVITRVWEREVWVDTPAPVYVLDGLRCTGAVLGTDGPCDRACHVLWHRDWLVLEA